MYEKKIGNLYGFQGGTFAGNVYGTDGVSPTILTCGGGGRQPHIVRACALRGRGEGWRHNLELRPDSNANAIDTVPKDSMVMMAYDEQNDLIRADSFGTIQTDGSSPKHNNRVISTMPVNTEPDGSSRTIKAQYWKNSAANMERQDALGCTGAVDLIAHEDEDDWVWDVNGERYRIQIRKLTPRECYRLMDFSDDDFDKAREVNSNTQLYKQAGNSIVRSVLCDIFKSLIDGGIE